LSAASVLVLALAGAAPAQELASLREHTNRLGSLSFSPDGKLLVSTQTWTRGNADPGLKARLWDVSARKLVRSLDERSQVLFVDNDVLFMTGGEVGKDKYPATLVDTTGKVLHSFPKHTEGMLGGLCVANGKTLVIGRYYAPKVAPDDKEGGPGIEVYDLGTRKMTHRRIFPGGFLTAVALSPNGQSVALAFKNRDLLAGLEDTRPEFPILICEVGADKKPSLLAGHAKVISAVAFAPDGKSLATAGRDAALRVWDVATGKERLRVELKVEFRWDPEENVSVAFSPDGKLLAVAWCEGTVHLDRRGKPNDSAEIGAIKLFDADTGKELADLRGTSTLAGERVVDRVGKPVDIKGRSHHVGCLAFSPNGQILASGHHDGTIKLWDVPKALAK
jgi:WD40 repeat protein